MHQISLLQVVILDFPHKAENKRIILTITDRNYIVTASALPSEMTQPPEEPTWCKGDPVRSQRRVLLVSSCSTEVSTLLIPLHGHVPSFGVMGEEHLPLLSHGPRFLLWQRSSSGTCRLKPRSTFSYYFKEISLQQGREDSQPERG